MPTDLIPLPFLPRFPDPPTSSSKEAKEYADSMKRYVGDVVRKWEDDRSILMQDISRLSQPQSAKFDPVAMQRQLDDACYLLTLMYISTVVWTVGSDPLPPRPRVQPSRIREFLKRFSFA